jgi:hypothetical protein
MPQEDAVRDLLFGKKNQEIDNRFDSLESTLLESIRRVEERMNGRMDSINHFVKAEIDDVRSTIHSTIHSTDDRLRREVENRKSDLNGMTVVVGALDSKVEGKFRELHDSIDHLGNKSREERRCELRGRRF